MKHIHHTNIPGQYPVKLQQVSPERFNVVYGAQTYTGLTYMQAAKEYGLCVMHALGCAGALEPPLGRSYIKPKKG